MYLINKETKKKKTVITLKLKKQTKNIYVDNHLSM